jgi:hypothetical protein
MDNEIQEVEEITEPMSADYWRVLEEFIFPIGDNRYIYFLTCKSSDADWLTRVTINDRTSFLFPRDIAATQFIYRPDFNKDYNGMKKGRELARQWLQVTLTEAVFDIAMRSLPPME